MANKEINLNDQTIIKTLDKEIKRVSAVYEKKLKDLNRIKEDLLGGTGTEWRLLKSKPSGKEHTYTGYVISNEGVVRNILTGAKRKYYLNNDGKVSLDLKTESGRYHHFDVVKAFKYVFKDLCDDMTLKQVYEEFFSDKIWSHYGNRGVDY